MDHVKLATCVCVGLGARAQEGGAFRVHNDAVITSAWLCQFMQPARTECWFLCQNWLRTYTFIMATSIDFYTLKLNVLNLLTRGPIPAGLGELSRVIPQGAFPRCRAHSPL